MPAQLGSPARADEIECAATSEDIQPPSPDSNAPLTIRPARRPAVSAVVRLLADDPLGARREKVGEPTAPVYLAAFDEMAWQTGNEILVAILDGETGSWT